MKNFKLNTLEMTRKIREEHYHLLQTKSTTERMAFYRQTAQQMLVEVEEIKRSNQSERRVP